MGMSLPNPKAVLANEAFPKGFAQSPRVENEKLGEDKMHFPY